MAAVKKVGKYLIGKPRMISHFKGAATAIFLMFAEGPGQRSGGLPAWAELVATV